MKRTLLLSLLFLALPLAAFADNVDFANSLGTLAGSSSGLTLTGSTLSEVTGLGGNGPVQGDLGTVTFITGSMLSGSLATTAVFASGGSFTITGNGTNGVPNGVIFSSAFTSTVTWTYSSTLSDGSEVFDIAGSLGSGGTVQGYAVVSTDGFMTVSGTLGSGNTIVSISTVPEPGTLALLGTGLAAVAGMVRRKKSFTRKFMPSS
ncbi:MAG TPA: PEP-CTERM sorting domain-containing protein [Candidatus Acidoferrum sp.]|nr:PEP-CTERM sorting domain-containing protein [Candidatus Acidoferrum sp.]